MEEYLNHTRIILALILLFSNENKLTLPFEIHLSIDWQYHEDKITIFLFLKSSSCAIM